MGTLEQPKKENEHAVEALKKYFEDNFKAFVNNLKEITVKWSKSSSIVEEVCNDINLYMALFFKLEGETFLNYTSMTEYYWVGMDGKVEPIVPGEDKKKELGELIEYCSAEDITNTQTEFSKNLGDLPRMEWIVQYKEDKSVYKFIAQIILDVLKESIKDLNVLKNSEAELEKYIEKHDFAEKYIEKLRKRHEEIPDVKQITAILHTPYERRESNGTIYFISDMEDKEIQKAQLVCFSKENYVESTDVQGIRKLLEICTDKGNCLVASKHDGKWAVSGVVSKEIELEAGTRIFITFRENHWEINCGRERLLRYQGGQYYIGANDEVNNMEQRCKEAGIEYETFKELFQMLQEKAVHGALVIIATDAREEARRLCKIYGRGVAIEQNVKKINGQAGKMALEFVEGFTYVDGAVFFDYNGNCYGFSIILDGQAKVRGEKGRGSRFNSAINYIVNSAEGVQRCAVVRSEDQEKELDIISKTQALARYSIEQQMCECDGIADTHPPDAGELHIRIYRRIARLVKNFKLYMLSFLKNVTI